MSKNKSSLSFAPVGGKKDLKNQILKKDFNLLPHEILEQREVDAKFKKIFKWYLKAFILVLLLLVAPLSKLLTMNFDKKELNKRIEELIPIEETETKVINSRALLKKQQQVILNIDKNDSFISVILTAMEKIIPKSLHLSTLSLGTEEKKDSASGKSVSYKVLTVTGFAKDKESIADFQRSLKDSGMYRDVFVNSINEIDTKKENVVKTVEIGPTGELVEKETRVNTGFTVTVDFKLQCILNDWK